MTPKSDHQLADDIVNTGNWIQAKITNHLRNYGLTYIQYNTLNVLHRVGERPMNVGELKQKISYGNADVTRLVDRLISKKLVERDLSVTNRRQMEIKLSDRGQEVITRINKEVKQLVNVLFESLQNNEMPPSAKTLMKKIRQ
ncbi:MarR family winged helix-turn-helix transcriptional regulator [Spongiivirga citrea]|uniref:MarR family transcriptional regulator n=1 Tax=Spongiivirga citrea TaxID=1481457 RepID=A0A6M0CF17_9FLAO|nr:MarR family transcriptional regulator [Spongiivirga citrea]NER16428.1 MarR family transcriptional regulator [Spongiivirga citrea]